MSMPAYWFAVMGIVLVVALLLSVAIYWESFVAWCDRMRTAFVQMRFPPVEPMGFSESDWPPEPPDKGPAVEVKRDLLEQ